MRHSIPSTVTIRVKTNTVYYKRRSEPIKTLCGRNSDLIIPYSGWHI